MQVKTIVGIALMLALCGCSGTTANQAISIQQVSLKAQGGSVMASGRVSCPPLTKPCGSYVLQGRPVIGGDILPAFTFVGDKTLGSSLGNTFVVIFPPSGYTKFYINNLLLEVTALDKSVMGKTLNFALESSTYSQGVYTFTYVSQ